MALRGSAVRLVGVFWCSILARLMVRLSSCDAVKQPIAMCFPTDVFEGGSSCDKHPTRVVFLSRPISSRLLRSIRRRGLTEL